MQTCKSQVETQTSNFQKNLSFNNGNDINGNEWEWFVISHTDGFMEYANTLSQIVGAEKKMGKSVTVVTGSTLRQRRQKFQCILTLYLMRGNNRRFSPGNTSSILFLKVCIDNSSDPMIRLGN